MKVQTGFNWLIIGSNDCLLWAQWRIFELHEGDISWLSVNFPRMTLYHGVGEVVIFALFKYKQVVFRKRKIPCLLTHRQHCSLFNNVSR
jgi:hypothetical protein